MEASSRTYRAWADGRMRRSVGSECCRWWLEGSGGGGGEDSTVEWRCDRLGFAWEGDCPALTKCLEEGCSCTERNSRDEGEGETKQIRFISILPLI